MTTWGVAALAMLVTGLVPAAWLAARGSAVARLVGLELAGAVTVPLLLILAAVSGVTSTLVLPVTLALLTFAGTLVFTRLLAGRRGR
ncbi:MAG: hypothetical protein J0I34_18980 [Pseudonocardia sp.]|uniref:monovalent cation/H+ antiporter complex subunit F n=1 Tax=unclassified Pseudonocardia TaxID=2619320 RepID=UPI0008687637|nr:MULTISPECIES: monovalent cation/H+ antiporter complex subunit F [unclassified Pseudonocardia]MBN9110852.1 hypothetical protein [Pseudonocardia sp.]ODU26848.1 MAG: hypothetical protein ABS80_05710 [Pseudonocardia sp. SCN 72-51]ODV05431.1 MAG: hypothetical protein ABT15_17265 [Pseudonocardia sp. SCN 73-27]